MASVPSVFDGRGKSTEGTATASAAPSSVVPCCCSVLALITSTGDSNSRRDRGAARVPVTMTSWTACA